MIKQALATFHGVARRFTIVGEVAGITLVDDYGHHPAEIVATLEAARRAFDGRVLVLFQPHRYTRTQLLFDDFSRAFNHADGCFAGHLRGGRKADRRHLGGAAGARDRRARPPWRDLRSDKAEACAVLADEARPGDVVIALGAGDVNRLLGDIAKAIEARGTEAAP